eukprot:CAMPEP_0201592364 /NCGR_PEP_ID=MMETSP0190_2-20130828/190279_1 /ASSEMBLY_ACC=CAM_ASM_000263 /TAXON_ID=37353 /ORGANISM="Rosalina sp." /LENGTH=866 /DNA_ID=CAMNT_0048051107 /DNA_START=228 /DNA_END=2828 /DNA_ORIENTATION=+
MADGGILPVICNNGWTMIDGSLDVDMNFLPSFVTSYDYGRSKAYTFSRLDDLVTFREWFLPADDNTKFRVAPGCNECVEGEFGDNTVYYTDSNSFCFSNLGGSGCIEDTTSYYYHPESCQQCDAGTVDLNGDWSICFGLQMDADHEINHDHLQCVAHGLTFHPTISHIRNTCTCYQPQELDQMRIFLSYQVPISELPVVSWTLTDPTDFSEIYDTHDLDPETFYIDPNMQFTVVDANAKHEIIDFRDTNIVELYQTDFQDGTYRIFESGTYKIMEDIVFNFAAPSAEVMADESFSPNSIDVDELYWYPTREQAIYPDGTHPGLYTYEGAFSLGFFAGISVEADFVTIDLNGFTLSQDPTFYFQQRFFALIELASMPFIPGQGPAAWGPTITSGNHVTVTNGNLGLTSHHGIHGNNNAYVTITNVNSGYFDVAGLQCNACNNVVISDCIVGPQNQDIPVLGRYAHARAFIPRLRQLALGHADYEITFYGREPVTVSSLIDRLINQMDMIYHIHLINGPQNQDIPVLGRYAHARAFIPRLKQLMDEHADDEVTFYGREPITVSSLVDRLINQMDMIYHNAINNVVYDEDDEEWIAAKTLFYNPSGWMDGGTSYGVVIGGTGAQVVGIGSRAHGTSDVTLTNLEIFGVGNKMIEKIKFADGDGATRLMFFDAIDWVAVSDQVDDPSTSRYVGDAYTDCIFAVDKCIDSWYYLNSLYINSAEEAYVFDGDSNAFATEIMANDNIKFPNIGGCGSDIQLHSSKGAIGLRIDGPDNLVVDGIYIHDVANWAPLGNQDWCGGYGGPSVGGEDPDIQYGFTGTRSHGMIIDYAQGTLSNIQIEGIESYNGEANGLTVYKGCDISLENIQVDNMV